MMIKWVLGILIFLVLFIGISVGAALTFMKLDRKSYVVPILMYHKINYVDRQDSLVTSPENFAYHLKYLKENKYEVISLNDLVDGIKADRVFSKKTIVITFDDGFEDNYIHGFKLLKEYGFKATFFVPSDEVGKPGYLTWDQIRQMKDAGMTIGSHARLVDSYLPTMKIDRLYSEIYGSKSTLEEKLGVQIEHFAYPIGGFNDEIKDLLVTSGYKSACTTNRGFDPQNKDVFELNRVRLSDRDNKDYILWMKMSGYNNFMRTPKRPH